MKTLTMQERLRKLRSDLTIKTGNLAVTARRLRRARDAGQDAKAEKLDQELSKIKETIQDVKKTILMVEEEVRNGSIQVAE